jgi:four helix bundle protein
MNPNQEPLETWHVYEVALAIIRALRPLVEQIEHRDRSLGQQIRDAARSIPSNLREGRRRVGKDRLHLWRIAAGSADEILGHLDAAAAWGSITEAETKEVRILLDREMAMLYRMTEPR